MIKNFANSQPSASNFTSFSRSLEQFFLSVGQNNFGNKIPVLLLSDILGNVIKFIFISLELTSLTWTYDNKKKQYVEAFLWDLLLKNSWNGRITFKNVIFSGMKAKKSNALSIMKLTFLGNKEKKAGEICVI